MDKQIGFIGCGNMGMAMIGGMLNKKIVSSNHIICSDLNTANLKMLVKIWANYNYRQQ